MCRHLMEEVKMIEIKKAIESEQFVDAILRACGFNVKEIYEAPDHYVPYWITEAERMTLKQGIYEEIIDDKLIVYKNISENCIEEYVSEELFKEVPDIKKDATQYLELTERYNYVVETFKDEVYVRILDISTTPDPRVALMTKAVQKIITEKFGETVYVVTTERGDLFVFSHDDPYNVTKSIIDSRTGMLSREFEVLLLDKNHLSNVFSIKTYVGDMYGCFI